MSGIDTEVELYLAPEATGVHDWYPFVPLAEDEVVVHVGQDDLNDEPTPGWFKCTVLDPDGDLIPENPTGVYYGSMDRGVHERVTIRRAEDDFTRTSASGWGGSWTNGLSSGGTVANSDWTVTSGTGRHSLPTALARRTSDWNSGVQVQADAEVRVTVTFPVASANVAPVSTEIWFRADATGLASAQLLVNPGGALTVGFYDIVDSVTSTRLSPTATGLSNLTNQTWKIAAQAEGATMRVKVWAATDPEPLDWTASATGVVVRPGWVSVSSFVDTGNTNTKPLSFHYDDFTLRLPVFYGELTVIDPDGDGRSSGAKRVTLTAHDNINRLQVPSAPAESLMRRSRSRTKRWWYVDSTLASGGTTNTVTLATGFFENLAIGDIFFAAPLRGAHTREDTPFRLTGIVSSDASFTVFSFTPDARSALEYLDALFVVRESPTATVPSGYWPMEDGSASTRVESGLPGGKPAVITIDTPDFASDSEFPASDPILKLNNAEIKCPVPVSNATTVSTVFLLHMPDTDEAATGQNVVDWLVTGGTARYISLQYTAAGAGSFRLLATDVDGTVLYTGGQVDFGLRGTPVQVTVIFRQSGGTVTCELFTIGLIGNQGGIGPFTITGVTTLGRITDVRFNPGGGYIQTAVGHATFVPGEWAGNVTRQDVTGWNDFPAFQRFMRLGYEEDLSVTWRDDQHVTTAKLGVQKSGRIFDLIKEVTQLDDGFITGLKGAFGLELCTRGALTNQDPVFTLQGGENGHISRPFRPRYDYADVYNRAVVNRDEGITVVRELTSGKLSSAPAPEGIGQREKAFPMSVGTDGGAEVAADWKLATGTMTGVRIREVAAQPMAANGITVEQMTDLSVGARVDITGLTTRNIYGTLPQIITGYEIDLADRFDPRVQLTCVPYSVFNTASITDDDNARPDGYDFVTASTLTATQTGSLTVESAGGWYLWTTDAGDFPVNVLIAGEEVTISGVTGTTVGSPQTFTITARSVNGVVKAHATGAEVSLVLANRVARR